MDPDNQVPGGLFAALNLDKSQATRILTKFATYEQLRNGLEELSFAKHYERFSFAILDVKLGDQFRDLPIVQLVSATKSDILWMLAFGVVLAGALFLVVGRPPTQLGGDDA
jgi:hypothetical protein